MQRAYSGQQANGRPGSGRHGLCYGVSSPFVPSLDVRDLPDKLCARGKQLLNLK